VGKPSKVCLLPLGASLKVPHVPTRTLPEGTRGEIRGLSPRSGRRLGLKLIGSDLPAHPFAVVTLTYHRQRPGGPVDWERDLHRFCQQLVRAFSRFGARILWVKEFQRRGTVHYHLVVAVDREPPIAGVDRWVRDHWTALVEPGDAAAWKWGTRTVRGYLEDKGGRGKLASYLTSYFRKPHQKRLVDRETGEWMPTGRMWGTEGEWHEEAGETYELDEAELDVFLWRLSRTAPDSPYLNWLAESRASGLVYGDPDELRKLLEGIGRRAPP
jgi:hypothetical protein